MKPINVEIIMGHSIGISASYYRPLEREVLEDYLKAVSLLTIGGGEYQQQIENKHQDEEIQTLKQEVSRLTSLVETISQNFLLKLPTPTEKKVMQSGRTPNAAEFAIIEKEKKK